MLADEFCEKVFSENDFFYLDPSITKSVADQDYEEEEVELSETAENYISQIISIAESNDYELISTTFLSMESEILNSESVSLSEYERNLVLCTLAVGKYSNEYWKEYTMATTKSAAGEIIGADVWGALRGMWAKKIEIVVCGGIGGIGYGLAATGRAALLPALSCSATAGAAAIGDALL